MEEWQKNIIVSRLPKLIELTKCTEDLLANLLTLSTLSYEDYQNISAQPTDIKRSTMLYDIVQTRTNGFADISKSVMLVRQSGVYSILCSSFLQEDPKAIILSVLGNSAHKKIIYQIDDAILHDVVASHQEEYIDNFMLRTGNEQELRLFTNTIPTQEPYYIPRLLSNQVILNPKIFEAVCPDVFVVRNVKPFELTRLANGEQTASSSSQTEQLTTRFILLEHDGDFDDICKLAKCQPEKTPVHLVTVKDLKENEKIFIVEQSSGRSEILGNFAMRQGHKSRCFVSENELLEIFEKDSESGSRGFAICDSPGMGKSWLLSNLALTSIKRHPGTLILFTRIADFDLEKLDTNVILEHIISKFCSILLYIEVLSRSIRESKLKLVLFLDGFDEIPPERLGNAMKFVKSVLEASTNVKVFLTSRPHMRRQVEIALDTVAYDIRPFNPEDQTQFFKSFWLFKFSENPKHKNKVLDATRLQEFVDGFQKRIEKSQEDKNSMGTPFHCYMHAERYTKRAEKYVTRHSMTLDVLLDGKLTGVNAGAMCK